MTGQRGSGLDRLPAVTSGSPVSLDMLTDMSRFEGPLR